VACEVDGDIDIVFADKLGQGFIRAGDDVAPVGREAFEPRGERIGCGVGVVSEQLDALAVVVFKVRFDEEAAGVVAQVRRDQRDAQGAGATRRECERGGGAVTAEDAAIIKMSAADEGGISVRGVVKNVT